MRRLLLLTLLTLAASLAAVRPITHEDVWLMKRVGAPAVSPDGKWVVFSMTEPAYEPEKQASDLWIVPADGSAAPRRLTATKGPEGGVEWSPDSTRILFLAKREGDEDSQVYVLPLAGGEAIRITSLATGAFSAQWRPDGKAILFQSLVYPGAADDEANRKAAAERKARKYKARIFESFPIQAWDTWLDDRRAHLFVQDSTPEAKPRDLLAGTKLAAGEGFSAPRGGTGGGDLEAVWAPDGRSIVFTALEDANGEAYAATTSRLYRIDAAGGEPQALTSGPDSYGHPVFRPDGKALYALHSISEAVKLYSNSRLAMLAWPDPAGPVFLTAGWDRSVAGFAFTPDSRTVYMTAEDNGLDRIFRMDANGGEVRPAFEMTEGGYTGLAIAEKSSSPVIVATWGSMIHPPDIALITAGGHRLLTNVNADRIAQIDWQPPKHFWITAKSGKRIHSVLVLPPAFDPKKKYPLVLFPHGGPHSMSKDNFFLRWNFHLLTSPGYVLLMTNYTGSTGFGEEFGQAIHSDILRGPAAELLDAADEAIRQFPFLDASRQAAIGASYGGYLMNWLEGNTTRFKCLVNHAGLIDNISMWGATDGAYYWEKRNGGPVWETGGQWMDQNPMKYAARFKTPMLVTHGERDFRVPLGQALEVYKLLQRNRVPSRMVLFPDENHWVQNGENARYHMSEVLGWLKKYLD